MTNHTGSQRRQTSCNFLRWLNDIDDPEMDSSSIRRACSRCFWNTGGEVLASDIAGTVVEGKARTMNAIIRFPSKAAALGLYNDPEYQAAKRIRQASTSNITMVLVEEFKAGATSVGRVLHVR